MTAAVQHLQGAALTRQTRTVQRRRRLMRVFVIYIPVVLVLLIMLLPFYWMLVTSLKPYPEMFNLKISPFYPVNPTGEHYLELLNNTKFLLWFKNTLVVSAAATTISVILSVLAGYSLSRLRFRGRTAISGIIFVSYLIPTTLLFIPMAEVAKQLQVINHLEALIIVYPTFLIPFCTWLLMGYFRTIPIDLEECALIDGASRLQTLRFVTLPLAIPGIVTAIIFAFTLSWNEFIYGLVLVTGENQRTLPVGVLTRLVQGDLYFWGPLMAAALLGSLPVVVLFSFFVEQYVAGLTAGAMKG